jgi:hypothetical protein
MDAYQKDAQGSLMTGPDGKPVYWRTEAGDTKWKIVWHLLDLPDDRHVLDNLFFSAGGLKRIRTIYVRGGFATGKEDDIDLEAEDLDGTFWWIDVEHQDPADGLKEGAQLKEGKYVFKAKDCKCSTCVKYDGQKVNVYAKVGFAGMYPMKAEEMGKYLKPAPAAVGGDAVTLCQECINGKHFHKSGKEGCQCEHEEHVPF